MTHASEPVDDPVDDPFGAVVAEVAADAAQRRADASYPADLLRALDEEFNRWIPPPDDDGGLESAIRQVEVAAFIDTTVPVASNQRAGRYVKSAVRKATGFYHHWMGQQVTTLALHLTRPLRLIEARLSSLGGRLDALERAQDVGQAGRDDVLARLVAAPWPADLVDAAAQTLADARGRIVHVDATDASLVGDLDSRGLDVGGVTSSPAAGDDGDLVRVVSDPVGHLRDMDEEALGAVVLSGVVDRFSLNDNLDLLDVALSRTARGGVVAVMCHEPTRWADELGPVAADLLGARPLHPDTWAHLLEWRSARDVTTTVADDGRAALVTGRRR